MNFSPLKEVTDVAVSQDGKHIQFRIQNDEGDSVNLAFPSGDLLKFIEGLIGVAVQASVIRTKDDPPDRRVPRATTLSNNEATDLAMAQGSDKSMYLIVQLHDVELSFRVQKTTLRYLADNFVLAVKALDSDENIRH